MNVILNKSKNTKRQEVNIYKFLVFSFHENRKQEVKPNMFLEF